MLLRLLMLPAPAVTLQTGRAELRTQMLRIRLPVLSVCGKECIKSDLGSLGKNEKEMRSTPNRTSHIPHIPPTPTATAPPLFQGQLTQFRFAAANTRTRMTNAKLRESGFPALLTFFCCCGKRCGRLDKSVLFDEIIKSGNYTAT